MNFNEDRISFFRSTSIMSRQTDIKSIFNKKTRIAVVVDMVKE